uniref:PiggyBac transposable element-derived protein domain-containing protein n=1 Tax=Glossina austeni TaxID=7395 RepID=A0A1A9URV2_GLOAU
MKKFMGLLILMGQVRKRTLHDYWSASPYIETPRFSKTMSRNRFIQIWKMWHFCNNDMMIDKSDRLFKIRNIINYMENKFQTVYTPKQQFSLDEGIIPWRGVGTKLQQTISSLLSPFSGFNHHVCMDNYYNSVNTAEVLLTQNIRVCGTMRSNRGITEQI